MLGPSPQRLAFTSGREAADRCNAELGSSPESSITNGSLRREGTHVNQKVYYLLVGNGFQ